MDDEEVDIRTKTEFTPSVAADRYDTEAILRNFMGLFIPSGIKEKGEKEPVHQTGVAAGNRESRSLLDIDLTQGMLRLQEMSDNISWGVQNLR